jgi:hypothetical protein
MKGTLNTQNSKILSRGEWGCVKRKIVWGKVKHSCYFPAKTSLKFVSTKNKVRVSFCPMFQTAPFTPTPLSLKYKIAEQKCNQICSMVKFVELNLIK